MQTLNRTKVGMIVGAFYALCHTGWLVLVALGVAKPLLDWILKLHFLTFTYSVNAFEILSALMLVAFTFVAGYIVGWVFATLWNLNK